MNPPAPAALTPYGGSNAWSIGILILLLLLCATPCLSVVPVAFVTKDKGAIPVLLAGAVGMSVVMAGIFAAVFAFMAAMRRRGSNIDALHTLAAEFGGKVHLPSLLRPVLQPCWIGELDGAPVRVSLLSAHRGGSAGSLVHAAAVGAMNAGRAWKLPATSHIRLSVYTSTPSTLALRALCRNPIAEATRGMSSTMKLTPSGDPAFDADFMVFTADPDRTLALLGRERQRIGHMLGFNPPWISNLELTPTGTGWNGIYSEHTGKEAMVGLARDLIHLARTA